MSRAYGFRASTHATRVTASIGARAARVRSRALASCDSGRYLSAKRMFSAHSMAATSPGQCGPILCENDASAGPIATPAFVADDSQPSPRARCCGATLSATYAWITPVVPPPAPWMTRDTSSSQYESAYANTAYAIIDAPSPNNSAGFRPYLSDTFPHNGALTSCIAENDAMSTITAKSLAPNRFA